jgi:hypothetical protein
MAKTWATMRDEIQREMNIEGEDFVSQTELMSWANDGKRQAEAEIVTLYDKYLESEATLALTTGINVYTLPTDIYGNKITGVYYNDGTTAYEIRLLRKKEEIMRITTSCDYKYRIINTTASGIQMKLYPTSRETSTQNVTVYYIRASQVITGDTSVMDIPIADAFIKQYVKDKVKEKELGPTSDMGRSQLLEKELNLMIEALNTMIPDESSNLIEVDQGVYSDFYDCIL